MTLGNMAAYQPVRAPRGTAIFCRGWQQEAILRMLLNSLDPEVAERPRELVISGAFGIAAADWDSFNSIVASLQGMENDESLTIESGKLAGVSRSKPNSPRMWVTNGTSGGKFGDWLYAGTQTELPVLYELYAAAAQHHFGGTLAGKLVVGGGMGGAGGAQPLAAALHGAAFLGIDADAERIKHRVKSGYCEIMVNNLDEALRMLKNAVRQGKSVSIGLIGNCAELFPELARRGIVPDLLTDCTPVEPPFTGYAPAGLDANSEAQIADAESFRRQAHESIESQRGGIRNLEKLGARIINQPQASRYLQALFTDGWRLSTWLALSGEPGDIARIDRLALELFSTDERVQQWLARAGKFVRFQGLPARVAWLKQRDLNKLGRAMNDLVAQGEIKAPILLGYRQEPSESRPTLTTPIENGASWIWTASSAAKSLSPNQCSAQAIVADGTADAGDRLTNWLVS